MKLFNWIKNKNPKRNFDKTYADLKSIIGIVDGAEKTYELLQELNFNTSDSQSQLLVSEFRKIKYASNTYSFFIFYFPIVTHILYFKLKFEKEILNYIIGSNFADGITEIKKMIDYLQRSMKYQLSENKYFLTSEIEKWILNELPKM